MSSVAGFLFGSTLIGYFNSSNLLAVLTGSSLIIACGCVINNYIDRNIDAKMARTKNRSLAAGQIPASHALIFGTLLGLIGFAVLILFTNAMTTLIGLLGLFFYLVPYSYYKRKSPFGTIVGTVAGAMPIAAGYSAAVNQLDSALVLIFLAMTVWQLPHFYAIALFRAKEYGAAGVPVLSVVKSGEYSRKAILALIPVFTLVCLTLTFVEYTNYTFALIMLLAGIYWFKKGTDYYKGLDDIKWGRMMFFMSLKVLLVFCLALSLGALLP